MDNLTAYNLVRLPAKIGCDANALPCGGERRSRRSCHKPRTPKRPGATSYIGRSLRGWLTVDELGRGGTRSQIAGEALLWLVLMLAPRRGWGRVGLAQYQNLSRPDFLPPAAGTAFDHSGALAVESKELTRGSNFPCGRGIPEQPFGRCEQASARWILAIQPGPPGCSQRGSGGTGRAGLAKAPAQAGPARPSIPVARLPTNNCRGLATVA